MNIDIIITFLISVLVVFILLYLLGKGLLKLKVSSIYKNQKYKCEVKIIFNSQEKEKRELIFYTNTIYDNFHELLKHCDCLNCDKNWLSYIDDNTKEVYYLNRDNIQKIDIKYIPLGEK